MENESVVYTAGELDVMKRAAALCEVENMMSRHCFHHAGGTHRNEVRELWHSDKSKHYWPIMDDVLTEYADNHECMAKGEYHRNLTINLMRTLKGHNYVNLFEISMHVLSIPMLELSADGDACRAFWFTPGYITPAMPDPELDRSGPDCPTWMWERYQVDWCRDADGHMKICHFANIKDPGGQFDDLCWTDRQRREQTKAAHEENAPHPFNGMSVMSIPVLPPRKFESFEDMDLLGRKVR